MLNEAAQALGCKAEDLWKATDYVIATSATEMHFHLQVPPAITQGLLFVASKSSKPLRFVQAGTLDTQTLRGVRQLDDASVRSLDGLLPPDRIVELHHPGPKR